MSKVFTIAEGLENMGALRTGGQGSVYKGRRLGPVFSAVKLLPTPISVEDVSDKNYRNFINEVEKLKKVNEVPNPNVVKILSSGITESGSLPFIEMEFIEGPDVGELVAPPHEKIFTIKETIKLAEQLAHALAHCHSRGVRHGDIKSNNVKYNIHSGNYVLLDFGLSVMSDEQRRSSMRHAGAIEFMAPEQNRGEMLFQTDIYSFGVIVYELLGGQVPFPLHDNGETARNAVMISHMENAVPDLVALRKQNLPSGWTEVQKQREAQVPHWLLSVVKKCLEKVPEDRFGNGMDLHDAIILNSVSAEPDNSNIMALKSENEALQLQLTRLQEKSIAADHSSVVLPVNKFRVALGVMALLFALSVYGLVKEDVVYYPANPVKGKYVPFMLSSYKPPKPIRKVNIDSIRRSERAKILAEQERQRPKRKTFWDIF